MPFRIIDPLGYMGGVLEMMEVLKKGEVLSIMGDRVFGSDRKTVVCKFSRRKGPVSLQCLQACFSNRRAYCGPLFS